MAISAPQLGDYITVNTDDGQKEGFVTDLLSSQFVYRETYEGLPRYCSYDDWRVQQKVNRVINRSAA